MEGREFEAQQLKVEVADVEVRTTLNKFVTFFLFYL